MISEAPFPHDIRACIRVVKDAFNMKIRLCYRLNKDLWKRLAKCFIWSLFLCTVQRFGRKGRILGKKKHLRFWSKEKLKMCDWLIKWWRDKKLLKVEENITKNCLGYCLKI